MSTIITTIDRHSPAEKAGIQVGEQLLTINGHPIVDVLDYRFYGYDPLSRVELKTAAGDVRTVTIRKAEGQDLGLNFDTYLMDEMRSCANHCIFCFVDQMPPGMRSTLYFKDDDARLSFLLGNKNAERSLDYIQAFCKAGIVMNGQIVICPGWNDGDQLRRTLRDLTEWQFSSCSLVPVGITKYRQGLAKLRPVSAEDARDIIAIAEEFGQENLRRFGTRRFFCADELFLRAGLPLPEADYYEGYRQIENGVGMLRSLGDDFLAALDTEELPENPGDFTIATGVAAAPFLRGLLEQAQARFPGLRGRVVAVRNDFFGHTIDVAGLLTGQDLSAQLRAVPDLGRVLIPIHMLRNGENVFLDDYTVPRLSEELGCPVEVVGMDGFDLADAVFASCDTVKE